MVVKDDRDGGRVGGEKEEGKEAVGSTWHYRSGFIAEYFEIFPVVHSSCLDYVNARPQKPLVGYFKFSAIG